MVDGDLYVEIRALKAALLLSQERERTLREALTVLNDWASRMPDAGFNFESPRWTWWYERPQAQVDKALGVASSGGQTQESEQDLGRGQKPAVVATEDGNSA